MLAEIGLHHYLVVSCLTFSLGVTIIVMRRSAIALLMGLELILNAAGLNFVAFSRYGGGGVREVVSGQVVTIFIIVLAAAEAAVALGIVMSLFSHFQSVEVDEADQLKG